MDDSLIIYASRIRQKKLQTLTINHQNPKKKNPKKTKKQAAVVFLPPGSLQHPQNFPSSVKTFLPSICFSCISVTNSQVSTQTFKI